MADLKPCPFCGGKADMVQSGTRWHSCIVECEDCGCRLESSDEGERSGESWNRRAHTSAGVQTADNWKQYAKEGETAQECIERHRREQDALLKLLAQAREPLTSEQIIAVLPPGWTGMLAQVMEFARRIESAHGVATGGALPDPKLCPRCCQYHGPVCPAWSGVKSHGWISMAERKPEPGTLIVKRWKSGSVWAGVYSGSDKDSSFDEWVALPDSVATDGGSDA